MSLIVWITLPGAGLWLLILLLPWRPWSCRECFDVAAALEDRPSAVDLSALTVLIPARNESAHIVETLSALEKQGQGLQILLVDDQSTDATVDQARSAGLPGLRVLHGAPAPQGEGWSGKLWALEQGLRAIGTPYVLLLDADILLAPGTLSGLLEKRHREDLDMVSLMAWLSMQGRWERCLLPPFVFFFKLLYPFALVNTKAVPLAAAAGGVVLLRRSALVSAGGFSAIRNALIDDCALAKQIKSQAKGGIWLGLTHSARSSRRYQRLASIRAMVSRSAYSQLRYSPSYLMLATLLLLIAFALPVWGVLAGLWWQDPAILLTGGVGLGLMMLAYLPVLRYYGLSAWHAPGLVLAGFLFLALSWQSCFQYHWGRGACWKGRYYGRGHRH